VGSRRNPIPLSFLRRLYIQMWDGTELVARGFTNGQIASEFAVSEHTVDHLVAKFSRSSGLISRVERSSDGRALAAFNQQGFQTTSLRLGSCPRTARCVSNLLSRARPFWQR
jgi:hypothetical protein